MSYPYDESYLPDVQKNLGFFFQFFLSDLGFSPEKTQGIFLDSIIPHQIEMANPDFLCGKSGYECALIATSNNFLPEIRRAVAEPFYPQAEYWTGFALAFCQWKNNIPFRKILESFSLADFLSSYPLLHEADVTKIESLVMERIS